MVAFGVVACRAACAEARHFRHQPLYFCQLNCPASAYEGGFANHRFYSQVKASTMTTILTVSPLDAGRMV